MGLDPIFTLSDAWIDFLMLFGAANVAVGLVGAALRLMGKGSMRPRRAALFILAGTLFIVCSIRYGRERAQNPAPCQPPAVAVPSQVKTK